MTRALPKKVERLTPESLLTSHDAGALLQTHPSSIKNWARSGKLRCFRTPGGHLRIRARDLLEFLHEHNMRVPSPLAKLDRRRVLLLSEDADKREATEAILAEREAELEVISCDSMVDALIELGHSKPHIILIEGAVSGTKPHQLCRRLKDHPRTAHIDIVIVAGTASRAQVKTSREHGATARWASPLDIDELLNLARGAY